MKRILILLISVLCLSSKLLAQFTEDSLAAKFSIYSQLLSPEKIYIHTDKEVYKSGDTIWFKGYLLNNSKIYEFPTSNYIYVELSNSMIKKNNIQNYYEDVEECRYRVKIKRDSSGFTGYIPIPYDLTSSIASLRAYTYWMLNNEPEYMFNKNIEIINIQKDDYVTKLEKEKEKDNEEYNEIGVKNPYANKKSVKKELDLQFLPESGSYPYGHNSTIAFKAIAENGLGIDFTGKLFLKDSLIKTFKSSHLGMGTISVNIPKSENLTSKELYVIVKDERGVESKVNFPLPTNNYVTINLTRDDSSNIATINHNISSDKKLNLIIYDGTEILYSKPITENSSNVKVLDKYCPAGINNIAVTDNNGNIYANRSFFIYPANNNITLESNKESYKEREKVEYKLAENARNRRSLNGDFSVTVMDDFYAKYSGLNNNIVTYLLINSELKGYVENPQYYFSDEIDISNRSKNLDLVMLTHGWSYYDISKILSSQIEVPVFGKEYKQTISGVVKGAFRNAKESMVSAIAPSINFTALGKVENSGYFYLTDLDFPDSTIFTVSAVSLKGGQRRFTPFIDKDVFAKEYNYPKFLRSEKYSERYREEVLADLYKTNGDMYLSLKPLYIRGNKIAEEENIYPLPFYNFRPGQLRTKEDFEGYENYDLESYIRETCPPSRLLTVFANKQLVNLDEVKGIPMCDVESFAFIRSSEGASRLDIYNSRFAGNVILVKLKMREMNAPNNLDFAAPLGWQLPKKFYQPKYETADSKKLDEPIRSTLYWNPSVQLNDGKANFSFYTSDHIYPYTVIVEGILEDGTPVFIMDKITREN